MKMEKVKLTQEQAWMIENHRGAFESLMRKHHMKNCPTYIDELTIQQVVDAYFGGYEVEETFEVMDWVTSVSGATCQITKIRGDEIWGHWNKLTVTENYIKKVNVRHATPEEIAEEKQRRWWAKHDRNLWELREGDILISKKKPHSCVVKFVEATDENATLLVDGIQDEFYEGSETLEYMREEYKVFCFVEDRKDLEDNS